MLIKKIHLILRPFHTNLLKCSKGERRITFQWIDTSI